MKMNTLLKGRIRNTTLPRSHGLMPLFEAVVNSIQAIDPKNIGNITVYINRDTQKQLSSVNKRGVVPKEAITGFTIKDNGVGFNDENMDSFDTLDTEYKSSLGCRGVGRLIWLKAFEGVEVSSQFFDGIDGKCYERKFTFTASQGVANRKIDQINKSSSELETRVHLNGFKKEFSDNCAKNGMTIANALLEHCFWYYVGSENPPDIKIIDDSEIINIKDIYESFILSGSAIEKIEIKDQTFFLTHLRTKTTPDRMHSLFWCAANRVVDKENLSGKISGLHAKLKDETGDFYYSSYLTSDYLTQNVRPERFSFDISEAKREGLFESSEISLSEIREKVVESVGFYLKDFLEENKILSTERLNKFISERSPRYRPLLKHMNQSQLSIDPDISDKDLEMLLHKLSFEIEGDILSEGHDIMVMQNEETKEKYQKRLKEYLEKVDDVKKSDLANYVFHRKVILDILDKALEKDKDGKYAREDLIHTLIMPMQVTSDDIKSDEANLWLIDERLAFHNFLASDKPLTSFPIIDSKSTKEPDLLALNVYDHPILVNEGKKMPLASIVVIEIKRPMRNDAAAGEDKDPIEQALGYLSRVRSGKVKTSTGRPIETPENIPGYCYVICDLTDSVKYRSQMLNLKQSSDKLGYFGYNDNFQAYIEVISFDKLLNAAKERNRAFFDKLGLPAN